MTYSNNLMFKRKLAITVFGNTLFYKYQLFIFEFFKDKIGNYVAGE